MIGVRLMGGLGNQMFQYAAARNLALSLHTGVVMDMVFFENIAAGDTVREYEMDCFNIQAGFLPGNKRPSEDAHIYAGKKGRLLQLQHSLKGKNWTVYREPHHNFDPKVLKLPDKSYLIGYWQTEKYFSKIRPAILKDFSLKSAPNGKNQKVLNEIESSASVSIHVRRGDYVTNQNANKFHGTKDLDYYHKALEKITAKIKEPKLFIFSDDLEWCQQNLKFSFPSVYVSGNKKGFEDIRLMSKCQHNIIANSSFSWWAAWLNENEDKIVAAPKKWFNDPSVNTKDVIPESWLKI